MKKNNRKGFTIVELVIVIAVIAILATVLVPTFGNVIQSAKEAAAKDKADTLYTNYITTVVTDTDNTNDVYATDCYVVVDGYYVQIENGGVKAISTTEPTECYPLLENNSVTTKHLTGCAHTNG